MTKPRGKTTTPPVVLGVDPGLKETGVVLRQGDEPLRGCVVQRDPGESDELYAAEIVEVLNEYSALAPGHLVAVEGVDEPKWFIRGEPRPVNVKGLIGTAMVLGVVLGRFPGAVIVPPGRNGSGPLSAYPPSLVGSRETTGTSGVLRHVRSAYDVAGVSFATVMAEAS